MDQWYYLDPQDVQHGPFPAPVMWDWFIQGLFKMDVRVRRECDDTFVSIGALMIVMGTGLVPFQSGAQQYPPLKSTYLHPFVADAEKLHIEYTKIQETVAIYLSMTNGWTDLSPLQQGTIIIEQMANLMASNRPMDWEP